MCTHFQGSKYVIFFLSGFGGCWLLIYLFNHFSQNNSLKACRGHLLSSTRANLLLPIFAKVFNFTKDSSKHFYLKINVPLLLRIIKSPNLLIRCYVISSTCNFVQHIAKILQQRGLDRLQFFYVAKVKRTSLLQSIMLEAGTRTWTMGSFENSGQMLSFGVPSCSQWYNPFFYFFGHRQPGK